MKFQYRWVKVVKQDVKDHGSDELKDAKEDEHCFEGDAALCSSYAIAFAAERSISPLSAFLISTCATILR